MWIVNIKSNMNKFFFFFQAEDGIRDYKVTGVQTCALPIYETVATGFYDGSINGVAVGPGQPGGLGMICDDFRDNIYSGETWTANGVNASTLTSSNLAQTLFGGSIGLTGYQQVAYLVYQMFS